MRQRDKEKPNKTSPENTKHRKRSILWKISWLSMAPGAARYAPLSP